MTCVVPARARVVLPARQAWELCETGADSCDCSLGRYRDYRRSLIAVRLRDIVIAPVLFPPRLSEASISFDHIASRRKRRITVSGERKPIGNCERERQRTRRRWEQGALMKGRNRDSVVQIESLSRHLSFNISLYRSTWNDTPGSFSFRRVTLSNALHLDRFRFRAGSKSTSCNSVGTLRHRETLKAARAERKMHGCGDNYTDFVRGTILCSLINYVCSLCNYNC